MGSIRVSKKKDAILPGATKRIYVEGKTDDEIIKEIDEGKWKSEAFDAAYMLSHIISIAKRILKDYGAPIEGAALLLFEAVDDQCSDAQIALYEASNAKICMQSNDAEQAVFHAMRALSAYWQMKIRGFEADTSLGLSRRRSNEEFGKRRGTEYSKERKKFWQSVRVETRRIADTHPYIAGNKSELARRVKKSLGLDESVEAIRKNL